MMPEDELKAKYLALIQQGAGVHAASKQLRTTTDRMMALRKADPDYDAIVRQTLTTLASARWKRDRKLAKPGGVSTKHKRSPLMHGNKKVDAYIRPFLAALAQGKSPTRACEMVDVSYSTVSHWRQDDPKFAAQWDEAVQMGIDRMEDEAHRRAVEGVQRKVFHQGEECGTVTEYSDSLLMFLLRGKRPQVYARPETQINVKAEVKLDRAQALERLQQLGLPAPFIETEFEVEDAGAKDRPDA